MGADLSMKSTMQALLDLESSGGEGFEGAVVRDEAPSHNICSGIQEGCIFQHHHDLSDCP